MVVAFGKFAVVEALDVEKQNTGALRLGTTNTTCTAKLISLPYSVSMNCGVTVVDHCKVILNISSLSELPSFQISDTCTYYFVTLDLILGLITETVNVQSVPFVVKNPALPSTFNPADPCPWPWWQNITVGDTNTDTTGGK